MKKQNRPHPYLLHYCISNRFLIILFPTADMSIIFNKKQITSTIDSGFLQTTKQAFKFSFQMLTRSQIHHYSTSLQSIIRSASQSSKTHLRVIKYLVQPTEFQRHFTADPDQVVMKCRAITKALKKTKTAKRSRAFRGSTAILHKSAAVDRPERDLQALWAAAKPENDPEHPESFTFKTLHGRGRTFSKALLFRGFSCKQLGEGTQRTSLRMLSNLNTEVCVTDRRRAETGVAVGNNVEDIIGLDLFLHMKAVHNMLYMTHL